MRPLRGHVVRALAPAVVTAVILAVLPVVAATPYDLSAFTGFCINLLLLVGLNLISGYGGQLSLGQAALFGVGSYAITIGTTKLGLPPLVCLLVAPVAGAVFATLIGVPSLRLRGLYFAMATLGVGVIFQLFLDRAVDITGGPNGVGVAPVSALGIDFSQPLPLYFAAAAFAWLGVVAAQVFIRSRAGWGLRAANASEPAAAVVGVNIYGVRLVALALSGAYAGLAGAILAFSSLYVSPTSFDFFTSVLLFFVLTIGGLGTWAGPLVGAGLLLVFDEWLPSFADKKPLILAAVFLLSLRVFPRGVARTIASAGPRLRRRPPDDLPNPETLTPVEAASA